MCERRTSNGMENLTDGKRLRDARKVVDGEGHKDGRAPQVKGPENPPEDGRPGDGRGGIVGDEVGLARAEAAAFAAALGCHLLFECFVVCYVSVGETECGCKWCGREGREA